MAAPVTSYPARDIHTRRMRFDYPQGTTRQHYVQGDLVMSHVVSILSGMFPEGEDFFVRSVRHYADKITDPELKKQVAGFIGQEVTHGREHRDLNVKLAQMGYPTLRVDRMTKRGLALQRRLWGPAYALAMTAALEHYTATLAETLLTDPRAQELLGTSEVREMLLWHALEEAEHKSVAFDVFREAVGNEKLRIRAMRMINLTFTLGTVLQTLASMARDRAAYNPVRFFRSIAALRHSPFLTGEVVARLKLYLKPGFHPDDLGGAEVVEHWRAELFGDGGQLAAHVR